MKRTPRPAARRVESARPADRARARASIADVERWRLGAGFALIFVATLIAYIPALSGGLLWDDGGHVTAPALRSWSGLARIWAEPGATQQYYPLLHSAFWIEHRLWGDATIGYHLANVLWHVTSAGLLVVVLRRLAVPGALLAGLIFALHPVCVESVAWISEQKNTLSTLLYLAAVLAWLRYEEQRRPGRYALATLWFVAALLTKTVTATLPAALLVVAWWRRGRLSWRLDVVPLLPWLATGLAAGLGTAWFERAQIGATGAEFTLGGLERGLLAGRVVWFYFGKLVWPAELIFFYPRWTIDASDAWQWVFPVASVVLLAVFFWWRHRSRAPLAAALWFGGTLFPVLGFVNVYPFVFSYVADHFQYLAALGPISFLAAAAVRGFECLAWPRARGLIIAGAMLGLLGTLTWRQSGQYRDVLVLYEATVARNPASWVAQLNLGTALDDAGRTGESLPHLQRALELKPNHPETLNSLGNVLNRLGRAAEAKPLLEQAVKIQPRFAAAHNTLGVSLMTLGQSDAGIAQFRRAVEFDSQLILARVNLGWALANANRGAEALAEFEQAGQLQTDSADLEYKWGATLALQGRVGDAVPHFARAVELQPDQADRRYALARALLQVGRRAEAIDELEATLSLAPGYAAAREVLEALRGAPR